MKLTEQQKNRVEDLLSRMTLEEKIGQMNLESPSIVGGFDVPFEELIETEGFPRRNFRRSCPRPPGIFMRKISVPGWLGP